MTHIAKHTPGPWKAMKKAIQPKDGLFYCMVHEDKEDQSIAPAKGLGLTKDEAIANAHLIAAAPAMYEAIRKVIEHRVEEYLDNTIEPYCSLVAALAQAEARS